MPSVNSFPLRNLADVEKFETEKAFEQRCSARSVYDLFAQSAARYPDQTALTMIMTGEAGETPRRVSYHELLDRITRAANLFHDIAGPRPGVAFMLPNLIETHVTLWGAETAGYADPINFLLKAEHIAELVRAAGARVLVALGPDPELDVWDKAAEVASLVPEIKLVQVSAPDLHVPAGAIGFAAALEQHNGSRLDFGAAGKDDDVAAYFHTGGTTGTPKLVTHTHRGQIVAAFGGATLLDLSEKDTMTSGLPLFHVAGTIGFGLMPFMVGAQVLILSPAGMRNPRMIKNFWKMIERYRATVSGCVPTIMSAMLSVPVDGDLSSVRIHICGAAAAPTSVIEQFEAHTGGKVHEMLGMTECSGCVSFNPSAGERVVGSVGFRIPYIRTSVRRRRPDRALADQCEPHEIGVLTVSGPIVTPGYRNVADKDAAIRPDFVDTGDLAYTDEEGRIFIAGRAKDLIIRGGHNIDPRLIEEVIQQHPAVAVAAAVGQPDKYAGELPVCYVSLKSGACVPPDELREFAEPRIAERPAWPKRYHVVDSIPVTGIGKVFKPALRADATRRVVTEVIAAETGTEDASVAVTPGGKRGMHVTLTLPVRDAGRRQSIQRALDGYLFTYDILEA